MPLLLSFQPAMAERTSVSGEMLTPWGTKLDPAAVLAEYPRPQLQRKNWTNLNGLWSYAVGGKEEVDATVRSRLLMEKILVPFCPESSLSGVGRLIEPDQALWYQRNLSVKVIAGERTLLHFEAVDYETTVWVNDKEVGRHIGGNTPFSFDITPALAAAGNKLVVRVHDATEAWQLRGKQALKPGGITYTRVTGIWQTVWLEQVPERFVEELDFETVVVDEKPEARDQNQGRGETPDGGGEENKEARVQNHEGGGESMKNRQDAYAPVLKIRARLGGTPVSGESFRVSVSFGGKEVAVGTGGDKLAIEIPEPRWWTPETPDLYDLKVELLDGGGKVIDTVQSYTALRAVGKVRDAQGNLQIALNGKPIFLLGPLDQGWWPDGLLTPPSDEAMLSDLKFIKAAGFNMVRKHVKVEPARYYYHCDRLGLAVWQDQVSAGMWEKDAPQGSSPPWTRLASDPKDAIWPETAKQQWITEYKAMVDHLRDHPSVLIWSPFNEAWGQHDSMEIGKMAKEYDPTRLVCLASGGNFWPAGDIASAHNYPDPDFPLRDERFKDFIKVCGEMGGHGFAMKDHLWDADAKNWGYGGLPASLDEWKSRYQRTINHMLQLREAGLSAAVYTQTSDVEHEINGLLTYDRIPKVDAAWLKQINDGLRKEREVMVLGKKSPRLKPE
ncbi:MAG: glycoside hydrolase family 2 TIM barrel-domain containing protein [Luteolibacter sp.]